LRRLHDAVVTANAEGGIYVTTRSFTAGAREFRRTLPIIWLVDGEILKRSMHVSFTAMPRI
jgi:restriction endonuclease Mrr